MKSYKNILSLFFVCLISLLCERMANAANAIISLHNDCEEVSILTTTITSDENFYFKSFEISVSESADYFVNIWGCPARYGNGSYSEYTFILDGEIVNKFNPSRGLWQEIEINFGKPVYLKEGKHTISIGTPLPELPLVESIKVSKDRWEASINKAEFNDYLNTANEGAEIDIFNYTQNSLLGNDIILNSNNCTIQDVPYYIHFIIPFI